MKVKIVFYSMYGHVYRMAEAVAEGVREVKGAEVELLQVPELVSEEVLEKSGAKKARQVFAHIPVARPEDLVDADAIIFGTPTRFGNMCAQMRNFLDQTGGLWAKGVFINKVGSVFISTGSQHGGQETTITSFYNNLIHYGMIVLGLPPNDPRQHSVSEVSGGGPYGASTIAGPDGSRLPSQNELEIARSQGRHVATIALKLAAK